MLIFSHAVATLLGDLHISLSLGPSHPSAFTISCRYICIYRANRVVCVAAWYNFFCRSSVRGLYQFNIVSFLMWRSFSVLDPGVLDSIANDRHIDRIDSLPHSSVSGGFELMIPPWSIASNGGKNLGVRDSSTSLL